MKTLIAAVALAISLIAVPAFIQAAEDDSVSRVTPDRNIRVAPTFPSLDEVTRAAEGLALAALVAASDAILSERGESVAASV